MCLKREKTTTNKNRNETKQNIRTKLGNVYCIFLFCNPVPSYNLLVSCSLVRFLSLYEARLNSKKRKIIVAALFQNNKKTYKSQIVRTSVTEYNVYGYHTTGFDFEGTGGTVTVDITCGDDSSTVTDTLTIEIVNSVSHTQRHTFPI